MCGKAVGRESNLRFTSINKRKDLRFMIKMCSIVLSVALVHLAVISCVSTGASVTSTGCLGTFEDSGANIYDFRGLGVSTNTTYFEGSGWYNISTGDYCIDDGSKLFVDGKVLEGPATGKWDLSVSEPVDICDSPPRRFSGSLCECHEAVNGTIWISKRLFEGKCDGRLESMCTHLLQERGITESHTQWECSAGSYVVFDPDERVQP